MKKRSSFLQELFMFQKHRFVSFPQNVAPLFAFRIVLVLLSRRKSKRIISLKIQKTAMACKAKIPIPAITQSQKSEEKEIPMIFSPTSTRVSVLIPVPPISLSIAHIQRLSSPFPARLAWTTRDRHPPPRNPRNTRKNKMQKNRPYRFFFCKGVSSISI